MKKKTGSILIYVMMIFAVLMIMGATLSMLTMQNIKNRKHYSKSRVNLYYSESGVDIAYGIFKEYVRKAEEYSTKNTNMDIQVKIDKEIEELDKFHGVSPKVTMIVNESANLLTFNDEEGKIIEEVQIIIEDDIINEIGEVIQEKGNINEKVKLYNEYGEVNEEVLKAVQELLFEKYYLSYINKNITKMIDDVEPQSNTSGVASQPESGVASQPEVIVLNKKNYENVKIEGTFTISLQSTFRMDNIERSIKADFKFVIPKYASKLSFPVKYTNVSMTPVMNKGLVVNEKMEVDGKLEVHGDVYVKGDEENGKGIIMKSDTSELLVKVGSVTACEGVDYDYDYDYESEINEDGTHKGAKINIKRNLYTKNISFSGKKKSSDESGEASKGAQGSKLIVNGDVYVHDDLQIDSDYTTVDVGSYFGVSDGTKEKDNKVDNSSSIIINTENVGEDGTNVTIKRKVIIAGTSFIKNLKNPGLSEDYSYQTGESISVKGNYIAYSHPLKDSHYFKDEKLKDKDMKYELKRTHLSPLTLVTHYDRYPKWFAVYGSGEDRKIIVSFNDGYKVKFKKAKYFKIKGTSKVIPLHVKNNVYEDSEDRNKFFEDIDGKKEIEIILLDDNKVKIKEYEKIKVKKVEEDLEVFLYNKVYNDVIKNWIYTELTPRGIFEDSLINANNYSASLAENENEKREFSEFLKVNSTAEVNKTITIKCYDKSQDEIKQYDVVVNNYQDIAVADKNKSDIFKNFYDDYGSEKIKGVNGISIGKENENSNAEKNKNIYYGAILSNGKVLSQNYFNNALINESIIGHREDVLKDKRYYMDVFEKQYDGEPNNPYKDKDIVDFNITAYTSIYKNGKTPRNTKDYVLTPDKFIKLDKGESSNINKLNDSGLYVNYGNRVLLTNGTDQTYNGEVFSEEDILKVRAYDHGVIVCKGDLYMKGDFTITGTIIVMGNVFVEEGSEITIKYDESIVTDVIASEDEITREIFKEHPDYKGDKVQVVFYHENSEDNTSIPLRIERWVVVK